MRVFRAGAALAVLLSVVLLGGSPAYAHVSLSSSDPEQGATLSAAPSRVTLTFSAEINSELATVKVTQANGTALHRWAPRVDGTRVVQPVARGTGAIAVTYKVVSGDGHPVQGVINYTVTAPSADPVASPSPAPADKGRTVTRSWVWLLVGLGGLGLLGGLAYVLTVGRKRGSEDGPGDAGGAEDG